MGEALAVIGIIANIVQLVDFGSKILHRLSEFQSSVEGVPESFRHIKVELPVLLDTLQQTKEAIEAGSVRDESKEALLPAIEGCRIQIKSLDDVLLKVLPASGDSWTKRSRKAIFMSLRYESKVERITATVRKYIQTLTYYHAAASSTLAPLTGLSPSRPTPSSSVPFRRDRDFIDCGILTDVHQRCSQPASRTVLVGLGGVGKSQLAIEYAYRIRDHSPDTWVFWVHASSAARFEEGYRRIADVIKLPGCDKPEADILRFVRNWLCDEANGRWVMVVDNADDPSVFSSQLDRIKSIGNHDLTHASGCLADFLPQSLNGSILVTSRSRDVAYRLTGSVSDVIQVEPMGRGHALALLQRKLNRNFDMDDAVELLQTLDYMPLAITQAAAYISQREPLTTVSKYLRDLCRSEGDRERLLKKELGDTRRDGRASNSILTTWQISFDHIRKERAPAARLLSLMSLFDRQGIPETLLYHYQEDGDMESDFEDDIYTLTSYCLVGTNVEGNEFEMHRLVQFSTKKWLELYDELEIWKEKYITIMNEAFPAGRYENWTTCQTLFPHAEVVLAYRPMSNSLLVQWASILFKAAWYASDKGIYDTAEKMDREALEVREEALGEKHPDTLVSVSNLASVLANQGKHKEAEAMNRRVLDGREKTFGKEHPDTLRSVSNLASVLRSQGEYGEAETMNRRALDGREKVLGKEHPETLTSASNLASVLANQGKYKEAEAMNRRVLDRGEKILGKEHPDTLRSVSNLASVLRSQSRYKEAEAMNRRALDGREKVLGKEHPETLTSVSNLALALADQGKYKEAEAMNRRVLDGREKIIGKEHPDTLRSVSNLASVLRSQGKYKEAEAMNRRALDGREKVLGKEHPDTLASVSNLALVLADQGKYDEAEAANQRALDGREKVLGKDHPSTLTSINNLALVLADQGKYEEAEAMTQRALDGREKVLDKLHPDTLASVNNLALVLGRHGRYEEAEAMHRRELDGSEKVLGKEHPDTLRSVNNLASVLRSQGKYEEAEAMNRRALDGMEKMLGKEHPHTLRSVSNLALVLADQGKYGEAEAMNRRALDENLSQMITPKQWTNNGGANFYNYGKVACQVACQVGSWYIHGDAIFY